MYLNFKTKIQFLLNNQYIALYIFIHVHYFIILLLVSPLLPPNQRIGFSLAPILEPSAYICLSKTSKTKDFNLGGKLKNKL